MDSQNLEWRCITEGDYYIVLCCDGGYEVGAYIERHTWNRAIDRCLLLRRAVQRAKQNMQEVLAALE